MKYLIRSAANRFGIDIVRYRKQHSLAYRLRNILAQHEIDLILDVGANVGQFVRFVRHSGYSGRIVSFEPLSSAYGQLLKEQRSDPLWQIAPRAAIGDIEGEMRINVSMNSKSSSVLNMLPAHLDAAPASFYVGSEMVRMSRLDSIAAPYIGNDTQNIYLKIDVQGYESQVLEGAKRILPKILGMQIELSLTPLYQGQALLREMMDMMDALEYDVYDLSPAFYDEQSGRLLQMDGIFLKRHRSSSSR